MPVRFLNRLDQRAALRSQPNAFRRELVEEARRSMGDFTDNSLVATQSQLRSRRKLRVGGKGSQLQLSRKK